VSDRFVLDFDGPAGRALLERFGLKPHVETPSGGFHAHIQLLNWKVPTLNGKVDQELGRRFPGLDVRGTGGYAGFAGTTTDGRYTILRDLEDLESLESLPSELLEFLRARGARRSDRRRATPAPDDDHVGLDALLEWAVGTAHAGGRNDLGFKLACQLRDNRFAEVEAESAMREYAVAGLA